MATRIHSSSNNNGIGLSTNGVPPVLPAVEPSPHPPQNPNGANPPPGWSQHVGPAHRAHHPPVATQLVVPSDLAEDPKTLVCYNCQEQITTSTKTVPSVWSWAACLCLCLCLCWPCACIPFCCPKLNVTEHYCRECNIQLGKYKAWKD